MVINILEQKIRSNITDSNRVILRKPNLLFILNSIIEVSGENEVKLEPGDVFDYKSQIIGVLENDGLLLVLSESGPGALSRIWDEVIEPEFNLKQVFTISTETKSEIIDTPIPEKFQAKHKLDFGTYSVWKDRVLGIRKEPWTAVKIIYTDPNRAAKDIELYATKTGIKYCPEDFMIPEWIESCILEALASVFLETTRVFPEPLKSLNIKEDYEQQTI